MLLLRHRFKRLRLPEAGHFLLCSNPVGDQRFYPACVVFDLGLICAVN
jgi:hypothetical protein